MGSFPQPGEYFNKRYLLESVLGAGGIGTVFKAVQLDCNRKLAIKILHPDVLGDDEFKKRFLREAKVLGKLQHENIVSVYHIAVSGRGLPYIAMELLRGENLRSVINQADKFLPVRALSIITQCASALAYVHSNEVVHRDLKPENIILVSEPRLDTVKIIDFGLARAKDTREQKLTKTGTLIGSVFYMSPEQSMGHKATPQSDIYALGVILFELLTGHRPFEADNPIGLMYVQSHSEVPILKPDEIIDFDPRINTLLQSALAKDPANRFATMSEFEGALRKLANSWGDPSEIRSEFGSGKPETESTKRTLTHAGKSKLPLLVVLIVFSFLAASYAGYLMFSTPKELDISANPLLQDVVALRKEQLENRIVALEQEKRFAEAEMLAAAALRLRKNPSNKAFLKLHMVICAPNFDKAIELSKYAAKEEDFDPAAYATELYSRLNYLAGNYNVPIKLGKTLDLEALRDNASRLLLLQLLSEFHQPNYAQAKEQMSDLFFPYDTDEFLTFLELAASMQLYGRVSENVDIANKAEQIDHAVLRNLFYACYVARIHGNAKIESDALALAKSILEAPASADEFKKCSYKLESLVRSDEAKTKSTAYKTKLQKVSDEWIALTAASSLPEIAASSIHPLILAQALLDAEMYEALEKLFRSIKISDLVAYRCTLNEALMATQIVEILETKRANPQIQKMLNSIPAEFHLSRNAPARN